MDINTISDQLKTLEDKVEQLVHKCKELQSAKSSLEEKANHLEEALSQKDKTEKRFLEEKSLIRSKMDDLVGRLDQVLESS